jgi:hypothetical protein
MPIEDFQTTLEALANRFSQAHGNPKPSAEERNQAKTSAEAWFRTFRPAILGLMGETDEVGALDINMQDILRLSLGSATRSRYRWPIDSALKIFRDELLSDVKIVEWGQLAVSGIPNENKELSDRLASLDPQFELSYRQVLTDLADQTRLTYRGTANELREIFREVLDRLAPDPNVTSEAWFVAKRSAIKDEKERTRPPTRAEKVRYIMSALNRDSSASDVAQEAATQIDQRLGTLVNAIYGRASDASHIGKQREEILRILKYFHAVIFEIIQTGN